MPAMPEVALEQRERAMNKLQLQLPTTSLKWSSPVGQIWTIADASYVKPEWRGKYLQILSWTSEAVPGEDGLRRPTLAGYYEVKCLETGEVFYLEGGHLREFAHGPES